MVAKYGICWQGRCTLFYFSHRFVSGVLRMSREQLMRLDCPRRQRCNTLGLTSNARATSATDAPHFQPPHDGQLELPGELLFLPFAEF
jgi:hypothetical protein